MFAPPGRKAPSPRETWLSKLTAAIHTPFKRATVPKNLVQESTPVSQQERALVSVNRYVQIRAPSTQRKSPLFSLPIEIREIVYQYVFGPSLIHILPMGRRLAHVRCSKWQPGESWDGHGHGRPGWEAGTTVIDVADDPNDQLLALCLSCRVIYTEAIPFLYSTPLFAVLNAAHFFDSSSSNLGTLVHIQNLHLHIRFFRFPQHRNRTSTPHDMAGWSHICRNIAALTSLRYLCITISQLRFDFDLRSENENARLVDELLSPLKSIRVEKFDIITEGWKVPRELGDDLPFRVTFEDAPPD